MSDEEKSVIDSLWKMYYGAACTQARHHETQRSSVTAAALVISAAILGIVTLDKNVQVNDTALTLFLVALGGFFPQPSP